MNKLTVAEAVIKTLEELGVKRIFGIPGGASMNLDDAATKDGTNIKYTLCGDEIGAAFQAEAYGTLAREFGYETVGVLQVTSGPAAIKALTGIRQSRDDSRPLLVFTGNVPRNAPPDAFQGCDIVSAALGGSLAKKAIYIDDPNAAQRLVLDGYRVAVNGRPGSVLLDLPRDVLASSVPYLSLEELLNSGQLDLPLDYSSNINQDDTRQIAYALRRARNPLLILGQGARGASDNVNQLMEMEELYAVTSLFGLDVLSPKNSRNLGLGGMHGSSEANLAHARSSFRMYLGSSIDDRLMLGSHDGNPHDGIMIVHVDRDFRQIGKIIQPTYRVVGDVNQFLSILLQELRQINEPHNHHEWNAKIERWHSELKKPDYSSIDGLLSEHVITELDRVFNDAYVITDVGAHQMRIASMTGRTKLSSGRLGCMGYALGAGLGTIRAINDYNLPMKPVLVGQGDGCTIMSAHEWFDVARCVAEFGPENVPLKVVVFADGVLGMVHFWLDERHNGNTVSSDLAYNGMVNFDFPNLARSYSVNMPGGIRYNVPGRVVSTKAELKDAVKEMYSTPGPYVLQAMIPAAEVTPVIFPGGNTKTAIHTYRDGRPVPLTQILKEKGL